MRSLPAQSSVNVEDAAVTATQQRRYVSGSNRARFETYTIWQLTLLADEQTIPFGYPHEVEGVPQTQLSEIKAFLADPTAITHSLKQNTREEWFGLVAMVMIGLSFLGLASLGLFVETVIMPREISCDLGGVDRTLIKRLPFLDPYHTRISLSSLGSYWIRILCDQQFLPQKHIVCCSEA